MVGCFWWLVVTETCDSGRKFGNPLSGSNVRDIRLNPVECTGLWICFWEDCCVILMKSSTYKWTLKIALTSKCLPWKSLSKWDEVASMKLNNDLRLKVDCKGFVTLLYVLSSHTGIAANFWTSERIRVLWICVWGSNMKGGGQRSLIPSLRGRCWWKAFLTD